MIVFDSSTLILLAKVEILDDFLNDYNGEVIIPYEVKEECCSRKNSFDALLIGRRVDEKKIKTGKIRNVKLCEKFMKDFSISRGEAEALVLFIEKKAETKTELFAADDKNAIKASKILMIPFTSALAILTRLVEKGIIDNTKAKVKLGMLARYGRYKDSMIKEAKERLHITEGE